MPRPYAIDPAHYIARFAALLEFGDETPKVAHDAARLVKRFRADWMNTGRRPAGICGACLLIAARMNNFRRSVQEIVQVVKIAEQTVVKRLEEFKETHSSALTVSEFRDDDKWLPEAEEAPPIVKQQERKKEKLLKRKRKRDGEDDDGQGEPESPSRSTSATPSQVAEPPPSEIPPPIDLESELFRGVGLTEADLYPDGLGVQEPIDMSPEPSISQKPLFLQDDDDETNGDPRHLAQEAAEAQTMFNSVPNGGLPGYDFDFAIDPALLNEGFHSQPSSAMPPRQNQPQNEWDDPEIEDEVQTLLHAPQAEEVSAEVDEEQEQQRATRRRRPPEDKLDDLDEDELDAFIMTEEEVRLKTRVWVELNRDYLEKLAGMCLCADLHAS